MYDIAAGDLWRWRRRIQTVKSGNNHVPVNVEKGEPRTGRKKCQLAGSKGPVWDVRRVLTWERTGQEGLILPERVWDKFMWQGEVQEGQYEWGYEGRVWNGKSRKR